MAEIFFNGGIGKIHGSFIDIGDECSPVALILHSHPHHGQTGKHGGNMNNVVINEVYRRFAQNNISVLKMNFRGIGKSVGEFDNGPGEILDASMAIDWLLNKKPRTKVVWAVGFSFGSWVALQITMRRPEVTNFIAISPPYNKYDFSFLSPCPAPGFIIHGSNDSIVPESFVVDFVDKLSRQKSSNIQYEIISGADHLYRDKVENLGNAVDSSIKKGMKDNEEIYSKESLNSMLLK